MNFPYYFSATLREELQRTQKGYPALWEKGGGYSSTGKVQLIAGPQGEKKRPVYIRQRGELAGKEHALFVVEPGDLVVYIKRKRSDYMKAVYRIAKLKEDTAILERLHLFDFGQWDTDPPEAFQDVLEAARKKSWCYHCRTPHYAIEGGPKQKVQ